MMMESMSQGDNGGRIDAGAPEGDEALARKLQEEEDKLRAAVEGDEDLAKELNAKYNNGGAAEEVMAGECDWQRTADTNDNDAEIGSAQAGAAGERPSAAILPPAPAGASSAITTSIPNTAAAPSVAGVEYHPSSDDAPVPLAQALAAYDEAKGDSEKRGGVEVIESSPKDVPVPAALMDASYDAAEKGSAGSKKAGKNVELVGDEGPTPPGHTADDGGVFKIKAKKLKAERVRDASHEVRPRAATRPAGIVASVHEPVFDEDNGVSLDPMEPPVPILQARLVEDEPERPVCEAQLIEDESERPVYNAIPLESEHWTKRHQRKITGGFVVTLVAMAVALGVSFGGGRGGGRLCFVDHTELKAAVDDYTAGGPAFPAAVNEYTKGGDACQRGASECEVVQKYGWPIGRWCVSDVTDMSNLFAYKRNFDDDLSMWDTSSVTAMDYMFYQARSFNGDVSNFDTSSVTSMYRMFAGAWSFNGDLSGWNVASVGDMRGMFYEATSFNQSLSNFNTSHLTSMEHMFEGATSFNQDVSGLDTSNVWRMGSMFYSARSFNQDLCAWGVHYKANGWYTNMFNGTNCTNKGDPQGPNTNWCAATCP